jgi:hypothetical protein
MKFMVKSSWKALSLKKKNTGVTHMHRKAMPVNSLYSYPYLN